ncbi:MAG: hypothetical protein H7836_12445 [Magnetococcus sp. YQC-3]
MLLNNIGNLILEVFNNDISTFINQLMVDFGPGGSAGLDLEYMRKIKNVLGINGGEVSQLIELIQSGAPIENIINSLKDSSRNF